MAQNEPVGGPWTEAVRAALGRGLALDPSLLAHRSRAEFLARLRASERDVGPLLVPFPVAHLWAIARTDPAPTISYLLSPQMQLPLFDRSSYPPSLGAAADWIRREPWIHSVRGEAALRTSLEQLGQLGWDMSVLEADGDIQRAEDLALAVHRAVQDRLVPLLSFSDVYRSLVQARGRPILEAPPALSAALFRDLGFQSLRAAPRLAVPAVILGSPGQQVLKILLEGTQVLFGAPS